VDLSAFAGDVAPVRSNRRHLHDALLRRNAPARNDLAADVPYLRCANETCRRWFVRQRGRTTYGGNRMRGVMSREGTYVGRSTVTVKRVCDDWLAGKRGVRPTTLAGYRDVLKPVVAAYGSLPVQRLTKRHLDDLIPLLTAGGLARTDGRSRRPWSARTVNSMLFVLGEVLGDAMRQGLVTRNVAALVDRLPQSRTEIDTFTQSEVRKVLAVARGDRLELAWNLALSGLRRGEVCGLRWTDVDFLAQTLTMSRTASPSTGQL
jgi:hypothetical protein